MGFAIQTSLSGQVEWGIKPLFVEERVIEPEKKQFYQPLYKQIYSWELLMTGTQSWPTLPAFLDFENDLTMLDFYIPVQAESIYTIKGRITNVSKGSTKLYPTEF